MEKWKTVITDNPVINEREDGIYMYFHDLPPILYDDPIHISDNDLCPPTIDACWRKQFNV